MRNQDRAVINKFQGPHQKNFWVGLFYLVSLWCLASARAVETDVDERLIAALTDPSFKVRVQAAILIGKKQLVTAGPALRRALQDEHDSVQAAAALALGKLGHQAARPDLCTLLGNPNTLVSQSAEKSLVLLDQARGPIKALINTSAASQSPGVSPTLARRLDRVLRDKLNKQPMLVLSAGEDTVLTRDKLAEHLKMRKLKGYLLQPRISNLSSSVHGRKTLFVCKVSIIVASLEQMRMEFSVLGEASAEMTDPTVDERDDLTNTLLDAAAGEALDQIIENIVRQSMQ